MAAVNTTSYPARNVGIPGTELTPDNSALFGIIGKLHNTAAANSKSLAAVAIGTSTTPVLTAVQFVQGFWDVSGSPGGAFTLTTPTSAQIISALPSTIPQDGTFNFLTRVINDGSGQTATVTAGTGVTVLGTATVANNTTRLYFVNVNVGAATVTIMNFGSLSL
jgi:hypothetical protein